VGIRAGDVVRLTRLLKENNGFSEVYGLARKEMTPVLLHASAFDTAITRIALIEPYSSYQSIVMTRYYNPGFVHSLVPEALKAYDLPDLAACLAPRRLLMAGITDGSGNYEDSVIINKDLEIIKTAYKQRKSESLLNIVPHEMIGKVYDLYMEWIN
jgi:hypothetical protein